MPTNNLDGMEYCKELFSALCSRLSDINYVQGIDESLNAKGLARTFPEVRFCKGCVLPIVDQATSAFLSSKFGASKEDVRLALRCEGFQTLPQYYKYNDQMSGYSGSPWNRDKVLPSKAGGPQLTGANPDFCIRFSGARPLRMVGEVKYLPNNLTSPAGVQQVKRELLHYLSIPSSNHSDWGHDMGFGIMYCARGSSSRIAELDLDSWDSQQVAVAYFHA